MKAPDPAAEKEAIEDWVAGDTLAGAKLLTMHAGLVHAAVRRYVTVRCELEDLLQIGRMALLRAAQTYDSSLGAKFSTYATRAMRSDAWDYSRKSRYAVSVSEDAASRKGVVFPPALRLDAPIGEGGETHGDMLAAEEESLADRRDGALLFSLTSGRDREILHRMFYCGEGSEDVAQSHGVSKQAINKAKMNTLVRLRLYAESTNKSWLAGKPKAGLLSPGRAAPQ